MERSRWEYGGRREPAPARQSPRKQATAAPEIAWPAPVRRDTAAGIARSSPPDRHFVLPLSGCAKASSTKPEPGCLKADKTPPSQSPPPTKVEGTASGPGQS